MTTHFDLARRATLTLEGASPDLARRLAAQLDPYAPSGRGAAPEVVLRAGAQPRRWTDVQGPTGDGLRTASDGDAFALLEGERHCTVPDPLAGGPLTFAYEAGFPVARIFAPVIRPTLQVAMPLHGGAALHASSVELDGGAVGVAGWSESGKTETALALMERGARFISDKWTTLGEDGIAAPFPARVGIRRWVLRYLPRLRSSLPALATGQLAVGGVAPGGLRLVPGALRDGPAGALLHRFASLAERASLSPTELRAAYGDRGERPPHAPLRALVLLTTVPGGERPQAGPADPDWAAERLARSAAFERRSLFALNERARYALPQRGGDLLATAVDSERTLLARMLAGVPVIEVRAPFPTDPRPVAAALERLL